MRPCERLNKGPLGFYFRSTMRGTILGLHWLLFGVAKVWGLTPRDVVGMAKLRPSSAAANACFQGYFLLNHRAWQLFAHCLILHGNGVVVIVNHSLDHFVPYPCY